MMLYPRKESLLHVRGGVSNANRTAQTPFWSSPRPWRCFPGIENDRRLVCVFSTSVEVFLAPDASLSKVISLLHVRGGVSWKEVPDLFENLSSPRPWRCFCDRLPFGTSFYVFSTSVEVFLRFCPILEAQVRLLHVRGGVSNSCDGDEGHRKSSPRPWRCFHSDVCALALVGVFSTSVEVFLSTFGDRSPASQSSPRLWRCFRVSSDGP